MKDRVLYIILRFLFTEKVNTRIVKLIIFPKYRRTMFPPNKEDIQPPFPPKLKTPNLKTPPVHPKNLNNQNPYSLSSFPKFLLPIAAEIHSNLSHGYQRRSFRSSQANFPRFLRSRCTLLLNFQFHFPNFLFSALSEPQFFCLPLFRQARQSTWTPFGK